MEEILHNATWLFYGDLDEHFDNFTKAVFSQDLKKWGFGEIKMEPDFAVAYLLFISELCKLNLVDYGTSPRGAWLTEQGERFKKIVMENENAIAETRDYLYEKYNG